MPDDRGPALEEEARAYGRALLGATPAAYVATQYARAHQHLALQPTTPFDRALLALAAHGPWMLRAADGYARIFTPTSALRRKVTVLVAILESAGPGAIAFTATEARPAAVVVRLLGTGLGFALLLGAGVILLAPIHLASRLKGRER